ncbi:hypothetical protein [Cellulomonas sp. NPDC058312]|uniref:hypothetical protein n=1 Tax=Cellulomonas sp. NPDC058312 TaxID=3346441 RepID=UPI0036E686EC
MSAEHKPDMMAGARCDTCMPVAEWPCRPALLKAHANHQADLAAIAGWQQRMKTRHDWPRATPNGHTYERPRTWEELENLILVMGVAEIEGWDEAERPPEPVWEMIGLAQQEILRLGVKLAKIRDRANGENASLNGIRADILAILADGE